MRCRENLAVGEKTQNFFVGLIFWWRFGRVAFGEGVEEVGDFLGKGGYGGAFVPYEGDVAGWFEDGFPVDFGSGLVEPMECLSGGDKVE